MKRILTLKHAICLICLITLFAACQKDDILVYKGKDKVNINYKDMENLNKDSIDIAYGFISDQKKVIDLKLLLMGYAKDYDREVKVSVTSKDGATAGTHYEIPTPIIIPKGEVQKTVPLTILRPVDLMQNGPRSFSLQIINSKDLEPGIQTTLFVRISDDIPEKWVGDEKWFMNKIAEYFGECSKTKYLFIYKELNIWDFSAWSFYGMMGDTKKFLPAKRILKERLATYEAQNGPLTDPVKGRVTFPD